MRIVSGESKGMRLARFKGRKVRPTSDKVKGAIFNILGEAFDSKEVLDLFAGTGSLGIEALSRGARKVVFVENSLYALDILYKNLTQCGYEGKTEIIKNVIERAVKILQRKGDRFDYIFIDPPYEKGMIEGTLALLSEDDILEEDGVIISEHSSRELPAERYGDLTCMDQRRYGGTFITFYRKDFPRKELHE